MLRGFSNLASSLNRPVSVLSVSQHLKFHPTIIPSSLINSFIVQQINFRALHQVQLKCIKEWPDLSHFYPRKLLITMASLVSKRALIFQRSNWHISTWQKSFILTPTRRLMQDRWGSIFNIRHSGRVSIHPVTVTNLLKLFTGIFSNCGGLWSTERWIKKS